MGLQSKGLTRSKEVEAGTGVGGWGVTWVDADSRSGALSEQASCGVQ